MDNKLILGVIGGKGKMGAFFSELLKNEVEEIIISDLDTELSNKELVKKSHVIIVTVPITKTKKVIEEIASDLRNDQLILDLTSLKTGPIDAMMHSKASVIGLHPLFGPSVKNLSNQRIVICPTRPGKWEPWIRGVFEKKEVQLLEISPTMHDQMMALIQSLVHFTSMVFMHTLFEEIDDPKATLKLATPVYRMQLYIAGRILSQSSNLYADIQMENPLFRKVLDKFENSFATLKEIVLSKDKEAFQKEFEGLSKFLGPLKEKGQELTTEFIRIMAEKGE